MRPGQRHKGFFQYGNLDTNQNYDYEDALLGDREGLAHLRDKIQEALDDGDEVCLSSSDVTTDFTYIKIASREGDIDEGDVGNRLVTFGCALIVIVICGLVGLGVLKVIDLIT